MDVSTRKTDGSIVVAVSGELDVFTAPDFETALQELISAGDTNLVLDLTDVDFLDSTGLGVMVKALKWAREGGGSLRVVATHERIVKVFRITGLDDVMALSDRVEAR